MANIEQEKEMQLLQLATDQEAKRLLDYITYNWEVAVSRMYNISNERAQGLYDDDGTEVMAVFSRMERVGSAMIAIMSHPQALLLPSVHQQMQKMAEDHRMDSEIAQMLSPTPELSVQVPTLWKRVADIYKAGMGNKDNESQNIVQMLYQQNYLPHMDTDEAFKTMQAMVEPANNDEDKLEEQKELMELLSFLGENIGKVATNSKQQMAIGLMVIQLLAKILMARTELMSKSDTEIDELFTSAKNELLKSKAWKDYWHSHVSHLAQLGSTNTELRKDAEEVERELLDIHNYLYTKMEESAEAFGRALKEACLDDDDMKKLLWLAAKRDAVQKERGPIDTERGKMEKGVGDIAMKLKELAADKYYDYYNEIWDDIMLNDIIASQLMTFDNSKYNDGFSMQVFCHIIGWLQRTYKFYGDKSSVDLGKSLGGQKHYETFKRYICTKSTILNQQTVNELKAIIEAERA